MRILVLDDEPLLLRILTIYLSRLGYAVETADGVENGLEILSQSPKGFGLVVLDGTMTGGRVDDLVLRILAVSPAMRVIVTSGYPVEMTGLLAAAPGRVMFLQKPFTSQTLAEAVRRMIGQKENVSPGEGNQGHSAGAGGAGSR